MKKTLFILITLVAVAQVLKAQEFRINHCTLLKNRTFDLTEQDRNDKLIETGQTLTVDYALGKFCDQYGQPVDTLYLMPDEGLNPHVLITNNGPDVPAHEDTLALEVFINNESYGYVTLDGYTLSMLQSGMTDTVYFASNLLEAEHMDEMGLTASFTFGYVISLHGESVDPNDDNNSSSMTVVRNTGIRESTENVFDIHPNPVNNVLNINTGQHFYNVDILNELGQIVYSTSMTESVKTIDVSSLQHGLYFIRLSGSDGVATQKFVK